MPLGIPRGDEAPPPHPTAVDVSDFLQKEQVFRRHWGRVSGSVCVDFDIACPSLSSDIKIRSL